MKTKLSSVTIPHSLAKVIQKDRNIGHTLTMSMLPSGILDSTSPRQDAGILWHLKGNNLLVQYNENLSLQSQRRDISIEDILHDSIAHKEGDTINLFIEMEASYAKITPYPEEFLKDNPDFRIGRGKRTNVPDDMMHEWIDKKLTTAGLSSQKTMVTTENVKIKGRNIKIAKICGEFIIEDSNKFTQALKTGIGKSKSYGLGLIIINPKEKNR